MVEQGHPESGPGTPRLPRFEALPKFGRILALARVRYGLSASEAAHRIGTSRGNYWRLENRENYNPRWSTVVGICKALGISPDDLIPRGKDQADV